MAFRKPKLSWGGRASAHPGFSAVLIVNVARSAKAALAAVRKVAPRAAHAHVTPVSRRAYPTSASPGRLVRVGRI